MIGYKRGILERLSLSQARMGQGSPLCETHDCIKDITNYPHKTTIHKHEEKWMHSVFIHLSVSPIVLNQHYIYLKLSKNNPAIKENQITKSQQGVWGEDLNQSSLWVWRAPLLMERRQETFFLPLSLSDTVRDTKPQTQKHAHEQEDHKQCGSPFWQ